MVVWKNRGGFYSQTSQKHFSKKCPKISVLDAFNPDFGPPVFQDTFGILVSVVLMQRSSERSATKATGEGFGSPIPENKKRTKISETHGVLTWSQNLCLFFLFSGTGRGEIHPQN